MASRWRWQGIAFDAPGIDPVSRRLQENGAVLAERGLGLTGAYQYADFKDNFEITEVAGHPAVRADFTPVGEGILYVGVADDQVFSVDAYGDGRILPDPCAPARRPAEFMLSNLPLQP